jgi:hypothetical protein
MGMKGRDEGGEMRDEIRTDFLYFIPHPSALIPYYYG